MTSRRKPGEATRAAGPETPSDLLRAIESARAHRDALLALPNVIAVRGGYKFRRGRMTARAAVVVAVDRKLKGLPAEAIVPTRLDDGVPTDVAIAGPVARLARMAETQPAAASALASVPVEALLIDQLQQAPADGPAVAMVPLITYQPPPGASFDPVKGAMSITCHVAPDASWPVLRRFLRRARHDVVLGMYDFTAPHIFRAVRSLLDDSDVTWRQTLGPHESLADPNDANSNKLEDKPEAFIVAGLAQVAPNRFESAFARVGAGQTFASAYHIKVAVRDGRSTWLSSGNWQSSNVPTIDFLDPDTERRQIRDYNREWNVVVDNPKLARVFARYLRHDFETAQAAGPLAAVEPEPPSLLMPLDAGPAPTAVELEVFAPQRFEFDADDPLTIQPILTPDNYLAVVLDLVRRRPEPRLYFQNQSLNPVKVPTPEWAELLRRLAEYSRDPDLDVRIIIRDIGDIRGKLESLQAAGFDRQRLRVQRGCHTKGIVIDSSTVLLGSHNWTDSGVQANRDASLLIHRPEIARYYERVFLHDWDRLARPRINENAVPIPAVGGPGPAVAAVGGPGGRYQLAPWASWLPE